MVEVGGSEPIPTAVPFGRLLLDLNHSATDLFGKAAQSYVSVTYSAGGRFSVGFPAQMMGRVCGADGN
jgi:hypothetical protein